jgi:hypothetical protein
MMTSRSAAVLSVIVLSASFAGCASIRPSWFPGGRERAAEPIAPGGGSGGASAGLDPAAHAPPPAPPAPVHVKETVPASPRLVRPKSSAGLAVWQKALAARGTRIIVSTESRALWLMKDSTPVFSAPVAVGRQQGFTYGGQTYDFKTPVGQRKVLSKGRDPLWVPPDWHYYEMVVERKLTPVRVKAGQRYRLGDGTNIEMRGDQVGRVNSFGNFAPFTPGREIIFDNKVFIPPLGSVQRRIPEVLGTHKLEMGDGYLIHGTNEEDSIGEAVSHGCVRMYNEDVDRLYDIVPIGTPVYLY